MDVTDLFLRLVNTCNTQPELDVLLALLNAYKGSNYDALTVLKEWAKRCDEVSDD